MIITLPRPLEGETKTTVDIEKPDSDAVGYAADEAKQGKTASSLYKLLAGGIKKINGKKYDIDIIPRIPLSSCEYISKELMKRAGISTKLEGIFDCPRCGHRHICEETKLVDSRDDIDDLEVNFFDGEKYEDGFLRRKLNEPIKIFRHIQGSEPELLVSIEEQIFRDVLLQDMLNLESNTTVGTGDFSQQKRILFETLIDVNGKPYSHEIDTSIHALKKRYMRELTKYPDPDDLIEILKGQIRWGMQPFKERRCVSCNKEWRSIINMSGFFGSALRSR